MADTPDILKRIVSEKWREIERGQTDIPLRDMRRRAEARQDEPRGFVERIETVAATRPAVIAELKKASPSKGVIREHFVPGEIAQDYAAAGAACLSVLTDRSFFQGSDECLDEARRASSLPVLRKDFIVDPYQVFEASAIGADCVLLIVAILDREALQQLAALAGELGLDVLLEVHDKDELSTAMSLGPRLIGVNNRNLHTFAVDLDTTVSLMDEVAGEALVISESGIASVHDVALLTDAGVSGFLVGESFMRDPSPGARLRALFG